MHRPESMSPEVAITLSQSHLRWGACVLVYAFEAMVGGTGGEVQKQVGNKGGA